MDSATDSKHFMPEHEHEHERPEQPRSGLPSLKELCARVVFNNLPAITGFGTMSYETVRPFLLRMDAPQLRVVEENSPHLIDHTEEIWKALCMREFGEIRRAFDAGQLDLPGSWRDVYDEAEAAREAKFAQLQEKMKNNYRAIAHEKEAKQIKVIEKAPPAKRRAFSAGGRPGGSTGTSPGTSLLAKARRAAAASGRQFGHAASPTSAFKRPGASSSGMVARPQQGLSGTTLYKQAAAVNSHTPSRGTSADARGTPTKTDPSFFNSRSTTRPSATSPPARPKSGIGSAR